MVRSLLVIVSALLLTCCGGTPPTNPPFTPATTTAAKETVVATTTVTLSAEPVQKAKTCTVPDVVGMVHQTAQDTMQANGLYVLLERDATGQGRLLINDRNWVTTGQMPGPGEVVDCGTTITLSAKKADE
ncbi:PASTA domain-containing protein [Umezawaea sp. NPDC059074]|uniref:PASTA domain-containing protein n=1 Tax=Umezawaea sp. NPDC059074 TaxID=3346716 RepID=UPI003690ABD8